MEIKTREQAEKEKKNQSSQVRDMFSNAAMTGEQGEEEQKSEQGGQENGNQEQEGTEETQTQKQENQEQETKGKSEQPAEGKSEEKDTKDEVVDKLRKRVAELETGKAFEQPEQETREQEDGEEQTRSSEEQIEEMASFITNEEFEEMQSDPQKFNEVLGRVYQKARQDTLQDIPEVVEQTSARQMSLRQAVTEFYQDNPDLAQHGQYIGFVANQIRSQNPDMQIQDVLKKTEQKVREDLAITKQAQDTETERRKNESQNNNNEDQPAFAKRGSGSHKGGKQDNRNDFQKQADEMIQTLR